jgi:hypothetical protein
MANRRRYDPTDRVTIVSQYGMPLSREYNYGIYSIEAPVRGQRYSTLEILGVQYEEPTDNPEQHASYSFSARQIAEDFVNFFRDYGVFVAKGKVPTESELSANERRLDEFCRSQCAVADGLQSRGNLRDINDIMKWCAARIGYEATWAVLTFPKEPCAGCGEMVRQGIARCPHCGAILDREKAIALGIVTPPVEKSAPATKSKPAGRTVVGTEA